jgi:hypothetical protein
MRRMILAICVFVGVGWGQIPDHIGIESPQWIQGSPVTEGWHNCRFWRSLSTDAQWGFVAGILEMWPYTDIHTASGEAIGPALKVFAQNKKTYVDIMATMNNLCLSPAEHPEYGVLPIYEMVMLVSWIYMNDVKEPQEVHERILSEFHKRAAKSSLLWTEIVLKKEVEKEKEQEKK